MAQPNRRQLTGIPESVKFYPLCLSMFAVIMIAPLSAHWPVIGTSLGTLVLLTGVLVVGRHRLILTATVVLALPAIAIWWLELFGVPLTMSRTVLASSMAAAYYALVAAIMLYSVLLHKTISHNTVVGAICVYLLIAFAFARGFAIAELVSPGSINGLSAFSLSGSAAESAEASSMLTYFSFVTITTLGYGDLSPATSLTRSMVMIETLFGQLFLIGFVARLVGMVDTGDRSRANKSPSDE